MFINEKSNPTAMLGEWSEQGRKNRIIIESLLCYNEKGIVRQFQDKEDVPYGKLKLITHILGLPIPYSFPLKVQGKSTVREIISTLCRYKDVEIIDGAVCENICI